MKRTATIIPSHTIQPSIPFHCQNSLSIGELGPPNSRNKALFTSRITCLRGRATVVAGLYRARRLSYRS